MSLLIASLLLGAHIASVHVPAQPEHNNSNTGFYAQGEQWIAGGYKNSIGRTTLYAAYRHELGYGFDVFAGVASGYTRRCKTVTTKHIRETETDPVIEYHHDQVCSGHARGYLAPAAGLSYTSPVKAFGATPRVFVIPGSQKSSTVIHGSLQWEL
jgi:hypothetical protein